MTNEFLTYAMLTVASGCLGALLTGVLILIRGGIHKAEELVAEKLPADDAAKVNAFLDVLDRTAEAVVQDSNSRIVNGLKQNGLFTKETAESVKQTAVAAVLENLGPLKEQGAGLVGPLEKIAGQFIEKHVIANKQEIQQTASKQSATVTP